VVDTIGLPLQSRKGESTPQLIADAVGRTLDGLSRPKLRDPEAVETAVERAVRSAVQNVWGKKPTCHVLVVEV
jgi:ribonuclease J